MAGPRRSTERSGWRARPAIHVRREILRPRLLFLHALATMDLQPAAQHAGGAVGEPGARRRQVRPPPAHQPVRLSACTPATTSSSCRLFSVSLSPPADLPLVPLPVSSRLAADHALECNQRYLGRTMEVLVEDRYVKDPRMVKGRIRQVGGGRGTHGRLARHIAPGCFFFVLLLAPSLVRLIRVLF